MKFLVAWCCLSTALAAGAETAAHKGSIDDVVADLTVPPVTPRDPAAGRRVTAVTPGWQQTDVRHVLASLWCGFFCHSHCDGAGEWA